MDKPQILMWDDDRRQLRQQLRYRALEGSTDICCGLPSGDKPWTLGEVLKELLADTVNCQYLEELVLCRTYHYAEIHWAKDGKAGCMEFGEKQTKEPQKKFQGFFVLFEQFPRKTGKTQISMKNTKRIVKVKIIAIKTNNHKKQIICKTLGFPGVPLSVISDIHRVFPYLLYQKLYNLILKQMF